MDYEEELEEQYSAINKYQTKMQMENNDYYEPTIKTMKIKIDNVNKFDINDFIPKQQLISFLEDKIRELNYNIYKYDTWHEVGENKEFMKLQVGICQEVLDFVRGGKDE